jgi:AmmeMemoRadiSam system protein A
MNPHIQLAFQTIETYLKTNQVMEVPEDLPKEMLEKRAGVFVSLYKISRLNADLELRGCMGTFLPTKQNIAQEIIANSLSAAFRDPRFYPVTLKELPGLKISVDVLSELFLLGENLSLHSRQTQQSYSRRQIYNYLHLLNPKKYGILIRSQNNQFGLLLPNLPSIDTPEKQIAIACQKAGLNPNHDKFKIYRFTVKRYQESQLCTK